MAPMLLRLKRSRFTRATVKLVARAPLGVSSSDWMLMAPML
jgi:hypothetical protein